MLKAKNKPARAFTLVELLVMIGIIAILACLMLPAYARATRNSQATSCFNNVEQIGRAVAMYAEEHQNYFPQAWDAHCGTPWWPPQSLGVPNNSLGYPMGSEWLCTDPSVSSTPLNQPATPAPMLMPYLSSDMIWVCPKRKRGSDYFVNGNIVTGVTPSISGYVSYGFNEVGVFDRINSNGNMVVATPGKPTLIPQPSRMVAIGECSGGNNSENGANTLAAVWDSVWLSQSGLNYPPNPSSGYNFRFQTSYARHNNRSNILYTDGHVAPALPSSLNWGQFVGIFSNSGGLSGNGNINLSGTGGSGNNSWTNSISSPALDTQEWSGAPE